MSSKTSGYSGKPVGQKLGIKSGFRVKPRNAPDGYPELLGSTPEGAVISRRLKPPVDLFHASKVTKDSVRGVALPLGLVDVKVCAIDETWSALKLVIRKEYR